MAAAPFAFIHTSDWHLGRSFAAFEEEAAARLTDARRLMIDALALRAMECGAADILVAGDTFNTTTPARRTVVQAAEAMARHHSLRWWLIPGNHDRAAAAELWDAFAAVASANVRVLREAVPVEIAPDVFVLPAPLRTIRGTEDPTAWMDAAQTPPGAFRIGLAHGTVFSFGASPRPDVIDPQRAVTARLDYLALGDRHTDHRVGARTYYSGSPERDRVEDGGRGVCLAVRLPAPGAEPEVVVEPVGTVEWRDLAVALLPGEDPVAALVEALAAGELAAADRVVRVRVTGRTGLEARGRLVEHARTVEPHFLSFTLDDAALQTEVAADDVARFGPEGTGLRMAAEALRALASGSADPGTAARALDRLYAHVREVRP